MFTIAIIERSLKKFYSSAIRKRGYLYYQQNYIESFNVDKIENTVFAEVLGSYDNIYEVELELDEAAQLIFGFCDCPYDDSCKHQAAVLYKLKDWVDTYTQDHVSQLRGVPKKAPTKTLRLPTLEGTHSGEYRKLQLLDGNLERTLTFYRPRQYKNLGWGESFEGHFLSEQELELKSIADYYVFNFKEQKIALKIEDGTLYVKCLSCNQKIKTLCPHQMALLSKIQHELSRNGFLSGQLDYSKIIEQGIQQTGVDKEAFHKYFAIKFKPQGFFIEAISPNFVTQQWIKNAQGLIQAHQQQRDKYIEQQTRILEEGRAKKFAFLWTSSNYIEEPALLYFVKGFGLKTKEGIHSSSRTIQSIPNGFPEPLQFIGQQLFFACQKENTIERFEEVSTIIQENIEAFNAIYQYIYLGHSNPVFGSIRASDLHLIQFHPKPLHCKFKIHKKDGLVHLEYNLMVDGKAFDASKIIFSNSFFSATNSTAYLHSNHRFHDFLSLFNEQESLILPYTNKKEYTHLVNSLQQYFELEVAPDLTMKEEVLHNPQYQILLREINHFVLFEPRLKYGEYSYNAFDSDSYHINRKVFRADNRDRQFLIDFLKGAHPDFNSDIQVQDYVYLDVKEMINNYWFIHFNEACEAAGIEVLGEENLSKFKYSKYRASSFSHVKSGIDWFEVDMGVSFGEEKVKTADWIRALRNKESFVKLKDGSLGVLPEKWLKQAQKILAVADLEKNKLKISKYRFNIVEELFDDIDDKKVLKELKEKKERLANLEIEKKYPLPKIINAELRAYQEHGYAWLKFLDESGFGGILADDMGLGKTLQVISLLADQIKEAPSLVVVPRSLLFNWAAELDKFCPSLKYLIHHGQGRFKSMEEILPCHVIITTYGTAASDIEIFKDFKFNYIILDESQAIKNPESKRYKAMRLLQSKNKIAMTGTPIENNTFDLYAQLSFTSPGLLGSKASFKNNFAVPIDNHGDVEKADLLRKLIHPFLLRRTKEQVAKDLPEKTESIIYCEMGNTQRKLYDNLKRKIKEDIEAAVEEKGIAKSKFQMLDGLLRLRQMCNSPLLINKAFTGANAHSVKIDLLLQRIDEELGNHNALIFSQFVSLLSIVREKLDKRGIKYAYLDGSTAKRQKEVDKFMQTEDISIFLISLKAGNTGMNLTKADYVYILDPWWNPAVEAQAIDRTHRIGQDKQIFAYKLICKDTIEEKILKLQEKKKNLAKDIIRTDENVLKSLKKEELLALFE